jgi:competence protein ComEC
LRGYVIDTAFDEDDPAAGVIAAMVLAQRSAVDRATNEAFINTGLAHFLAASGMNIAWLVAAGWAVMRLFGTHYRVATLVSAALIVSYVLLAEPEPSILRAGIVGLLWCLSVFLRGSTHPLNWLACAALVLLMFDPMDLFRPGFQLSFLAVLGLFHLYPLVARAFAGVCLKINLPWLADELRQPLYAMSLLEPASPANGKLAAVGRWIAARLLMLLALSLSAWFVAIPLSCYIFNRLNPWGAICTFIVAFLAMPVTCVGYSAALLGALFPSASAVISPVLSVTTHAMLHLVEWLARLPEMSIDGRRPSMAWVLSAYFILWLWVYRSHWIVGRHEGDDPASAPTPRSIPRWRKHAFKVAAIVLILWWLIPPRWATLDRHALKVWILAVGDGTGTVLELPNGKVLIYDFGTRSAFDAGPLAVSFLKDRGIDRIDAVFVTHTDFDHRSAIATIGKQIPIGRIIINDQFERFAPPKSDPRRFLDAVAGLHIPIETWSGPRVLADTGEVRIESIWPPSAQDRRLAEANETSMVLKATYQDRILLLTGDIAETAMGSLLSETPGPTILHADALALPHHGSVVANTSKFIAAVDPRTAVRSTGRAAA